MRCLLFTFVSILLLLPVCGFAQTSHSGVFALAGVTNSIVSRTHPAVKSEDEEFLDTLFAPLSIPLAGIPVLQNALGDVVRDSTVNVLDLLRVRDIVLGRPPSPSPYELLKGDLTADKKIDAADIYALRDILLRRTGVPYVIDSTGGEVLGDGVRLILPPGSVDTAIVISVNQYDEQDFASRWGVDTRSALDDSAYFMSNFEITSSRPNFRLPIDAVIQLDSLPPCAFQGLNGLFAVVPDRDGDGRSELFLINELTANIDSAKLTTKAIRVPVIRSLSLSSVTPGSLLAISGSGFGEEVRSIVVQFTSTGADSTRAVSPSFVNDSLITLTTPIIKDGQYQLTVANAVTGLTSDARLIEILPHGSVIGDIRSVILNFYQSVAASLDSLSIDTLFASIEDTTVRRFYIDEAKDNRAFIDSTIEYFTSLPESLLYRFEPLAAFLQQITADHSMSRSLRSAASIEARACPGCDHLTKAIASWNDVLTTAQEQYERFAELCIFNRKAPCTDCNSAEEWRIEALEASDILAALMSQQAWCVCLKCPAEAGVTCGKCINTVFVGFGPQGRVSGGFGQGGFSTSGCCVNIKKYKPNECVEVTTVYIPLQDMSPVPQEQAPWLTCPAVTFADREILSTSSMVLHPSPGSIVRVTNAVVPYNIVGILNENGKAFIPQVPFNTKITFSMYDPGTGLYDPNVGTYTTGSTPGSIERPILLFRPSTQIRKIAMHIGDVVRDSVSLDWQRIDYMLVVGAGDTSRYLNLGFSASKLLSIRLQDPQGGVLIDSNSTNCYSTRMKLSKVGTYTLRVAYGPLSQAGSFTLGVKYHPNPPIDLFYMCGKFVGDTLFERLSPYLFENPVTINLIDTVFVEAGVQMLFDSGGSILSRGLLYGSGTQEKPIVLQPAVISSKKGALTDFRNDRSTRAARKEDGQ